MFVGTLPAWISLVMYNRLPERMVTHIGTGGEADGYMAKPLAIAMLFLLGAGIPTLLKVSRRVDPRTQSFLLFEGAYGIFRWALSGFFCIVGLFLVSMNLNYGFDVKWISSFLLGGLFAVIGNYMGQIRFNYTLGIRTPWTLADEKIWRKTHRMAGPVWVAVGLILIVGGFAPVSWRVVLTLAAVATAVLVPTIYSFVVSRASKS